MTAPWLAPYDPLALDPLRLSGPTTAHLLGTDDLGRDLLSRILLGARLSLGAAALALLLIASVGLVVGTLVGYVGGWPEAIFIWIADTLLAIPSLMLALAIVGLFRTRLLGVILALSLAWWVRYSRVTRGLVLSLCERPFIEAARAAGAGNARIVAYHLLPNVVSPVLVLAALDIGTLILAVSGLGFLGLGLQPPTPEWGSMINEGRTVIFVAPHVMLFPGLAVSLAVLEQSSRGTTPGRIRIH